MTKTLYAENIKNVKPNKQKIFKALTTVRAFGNIISPILLLIKSNKMT